jgi:hypothetical protein
MKLLYFLSIFLHRKALSVAPFSSQHSLLPDLIQYRITFSITVVVLRNQVGVSYVSLARSEQPACSARRQQPARQAAGRQRKQAAAGASTIAQAGSSASMQRQQAAASRQR